MRSLGNWFTANEWTKIQQADCAVQVVVESANKSVNANQNFADSRCEQSTQVNEHHGLSPEEVANVKQDRKEVRWFSPLCTWGAIHHHIKRAIDAKLCVKIYAKSSAIGAELCIEKYVEIASKMEQNMSYNFWRICNDYYRKDKDGNLYRTEEDDVVEVLTEEQIKTR